MNTPTMVIVAIIISAVFYCEYIIYYVVLNKCKWPEIISEDSTRPVRSILLADTHLIGTRTGHWFDKIRREWQMRRAFQTAVSLLQPEFVFVLGDLLDEGYFSNPDDFRAYVKRFYDIFEVPDQVKLHVLAGNHDIGFHYRMTPYLFNRFAEAFNAPPVQLISARGVHFVLVNSMGLEGDGCQLCRNTEQQLVKVQKILDCIRNPTLSSKCPPGLIQQMERYSRPILLQHFPLFRTSDRNCKDFDSAPHLEKVKRFRPGWECLSEGASHQLLHQVRPRLVVCGHTHYGCTRNLTGNDFRVIEITLSSFSWRYRNEPNFALGVFTTRDDAMVKCTIPKESTVITIYAYVAMAIIIYVSWVCLSLRHRRRTLLRLLKMR